MQLILLLLISNYLAGGLSVCPPALWKYLQIKLLHPHIAMQSIHIHILSPVRTFLPCSNIIGEAQGKLKTKISVHSKLHICLFCELLNALDKPFEIDATNAFFFKASARWANAFYKLKCPYVCLFVCVCVHFGGTVLRSFCPHLPKSDVQYFQRFGILGEK